MWLRKEKPPRSHDDETALRLESERLVLRPATYNDYDQWQQVRARNAAYLKPYEPTWPQGCLERDFFEHRVDRLSQEWHDDRCYAFLIFDLNETLLGGLNINNVARGAAQHASLGYWLDQSAQGNGYMTEAGKTLLEFAFSAVQLARMNAATLVHNEKSRNMLLRLGFTEEGFARGYIQIDGRRQDHVLYGLNAADFSRPS